MQIFRVKPLAAVALEGVSDEQSLKRVLGAKHRSDHDNRNSEIL